MVYPQMAVSEPKMVITLMFSTSGVDKILRHRIWTTPALVETRGANSKALTVARHRIAIYMLAKRFSWGLTTRSRYKAAGL